jgi:hypothetical protein
MSNIDIESLKYNLTDENLPQGHPGQEQDHDFCRKPLLLFRVLCNVAVKGSNLLELGFCHHEMVNATEHLGLMGKVCLV